jgi:hypothetical protein
MARPDTKRRRQFRDRVSIEVTLVDHAHRARHGRRRACPSWGTGSRFWPATQARTKSRAFGGCSRWVERDILRACGMHRAYWAAIDAGRTNTREENAVEGAITRKSRAVAYCPIQMRGQRSRTRRVDCHGRDLGRPTAFD